MRDGKAPRAGDGLVAAAQAKRLPYLQAVIREALRAWPPVVGIFSRDVPPGGDTVVVDGKRVFLPGGVCVGYSAYAMHQSEEICGPDAAKLALVVRTYQRPRLWLRQVLMLGEAGCSD